MSNGRDRIGAALSTEPTKEVTGQDESHPCVEMSEGVARYLMALFDLGQEGKPPTQARPLASSAVLPMVLCSSGETVIERGSPVLLRYPAAAGLIRRRHG